MTLPGTIVTRFVEIEWYDRKLEKEILCIRYDVEAGDYTKVFMATKDEYIIETESKTIKRIKKNAVRMVTISSESKPR